MEVTRYKHAKRTYTVKLFERTGVTEVGAHRFELVCLGSRKQEPQFTASEQPSSATGTCLWVELPAPSTSLNEDARTCKQNTHAT